MLAQIVDRLRQQQQQLLQLQGGDMHGSIARHFQLSFNDDKGRG
jgi:hypothetical protein